MTVLCIASIVHCGLIFCVCRAKADFTESAVSEGRLESCGSGDEHRERSRSKKAEKEAAAITRQATGLFSLIHGVLESLVE